jgi:hypothetical protein
VFLARYTWTVWTLTRKRTQWRSVTSTVRYHLPRSRLLSVHRSGALTSMQVTDICERRVVNCPNHKASQYLAAFVAEHQIGDGTVHIALRRPIFADRRRLTEPPVVATLSLQSTSGLYPAYAVSWLPKGGGPSPEFAGTLTVEKCRRDDCFGLILSGQHKPPGATTGVTGGNRIARVPVRGVLRAIADYVMDRCAHDEAAPAGHSRYVSQ